MLLKVEKKKNLGKLKYFLGIEEVYLGYIGGN